jgi:hypothetical protein
MAAIKLFVYECFPGRASHCTERESTMNLHLARKLLLAADEQPHGFLKVRGREVAHEVQLLAEAGLVEVSCANDHDSSIAVIKEVTDAGHTFLRAFTDESVADASRRLKFTYSR